MSFFVSSFSRGQRWYGLFFSKEEQHLESVGPFLQQLPEGHQADQGECWPGKGVEREGGSWSEGRVGLKSGCRGWGMWVDSGREVRGCWSQGEGVTCVVLSVEFQGQGEVFPL